jgi:tetratricopeptide (TPR) repeat protein
VWVALGNLYGAAVPLNVTGAYESAKGAFDKAIALNPTNPQLYYTLAQLEIAHKDGAAAEASLTKAIELKNDYTAAIFLLSQVLVADGKVQDALQAAEAVAYFMPNDANALFQVGVLRAAAGDLAGSAAALEATIKANDQFANARYFLAAVYAKQGKYDESLAQVKAIASLSAENAEAVKGAIATLEQKRDPFPPNLLTVSSPSVADATKATVAGTAATSTAPAP